MGFNLRNRSLLALKDFEPDAIRFLLDLAAELKRSKAVGNELPRLKGKNIALIFEKPSTRTRCAFEVAVHDQGGHVTCLDAGSSQLGHKESLKDTARVLGRYYDGIEYRGFHQRVVEELAQFAKVPVWNGLTDEAHPTQILADLMTMQEFGEKPLHELSLCYLGDASFNMGSSLLVGGTQMGMDVRICAPASLMPPAELVAQMRELARTTGARITLENDPLKAVAGADFLYTDVWVSMGEDDAVWKQRIDQLLPYQVTTALMQATGKPRTRFMHCLPAFHSLDTEVGRQVHEKYGLSEIEVTDEVFESDASIVFTQAENRLHTIKAVLVATLRDEACRGLRVKVVVALGGNALLRRDQPPTAENQLHNIRRAAAQLACVAADHDLVLTHGNGPQVGLLALQAAAYVKVEAYPLDVLGAQTDGMIGYLLEQELANLLPATRAVTTLITRVEVDPRDPAFQHPSKPIGPVYSKIESERVAAAKGWVMAPDGDAFRRVVASPSPVRVLGLQAIRWLLEHGALVIAAGGGGIPVVRADEGRDSHALQGVSAVIDKDLCTSLLARELQADVLVIATDVAAVFLEWGQPTQRAIGKVTPQALAGHDFAAGSMGPKVEAARAFVLATHHRAAIGSLDQIEGMIDGTAGTQVCKEAAGGAATL